MSNPHPTNPGPGRPLPERPNLEHLKKEAKQRLKVMRLGDSDATLAAAQLATARLYGFASWRRLVADVKAGNQPRQIIGGHMLAVRAGLEAEGKSDYRTAVTHYQMAIADRPTEIFAHYRLGRALVRQQLYNEALDAFEELLKFDPQNLPAHYEIGKLRLSARNYPDELLVEYNHENLLAHYEIGKLHLIARYRFQRFELIFLEETLGDLQRDEILTHIFNVYADTPPPRDRIKGHAVGMRQIEAQRAAVLIVRAVSIMSLSPRCVVRFDDLYSCYRLSTYLTTIFCPSLSSCISTTRSKLFLCSAANIFASSTPSNSFT